VRLGYTAPLGERRSSHGPNRGRRRAFLDRRFLLGGSQPADHRRGQSTRPRSRRDGIRGEGSRRREPRREGHGEALGTAPVRDADGEMRLAGDSTFVLTRSFSAEAARIEWDRKLVYPSPREYRFTRGRHGLRWIRRGHRHHRTPKRTLDSNPPRHTMSAVRLAAVQRELARTSPRLLWMMKSAPDSVRDFAVSTTRALGYPPGSAPAMRQRGGRLELRSGPLRLARRLGPENRAPAELRAERSRSGSHPVRRGAAQSAHRRRPARGAVRSARDGGEARGGQGGVPVGHPAAIHRHLSRFGRGELRFRRRARTSARRSWPRVFRRSSEGRTTPWSWRWPIT